MISVNRPIFTAEEIEFFQFPVFDFLLSILFLFVSDLLLFSIFCSVLFCFFLSFFFDFFPGWFRWFMYNFRHRRFFDRVDSLRRLSCVRTFTGIWRNKLTHPHRFCLGSLASSRRSADERRSFPRKHALDIQLKKLERSQRSLGKQRELKEGNALKQVE